MNTGKQINAMVVFLFLLLIAAGAYTLFDPFRSESAEDKQLEKAAQHGAEQFTLNCRLCHGDRGQGGGPGGRLGAAPPLDRPDLRGIDKGTFSEEAKKAAFKLVTDTIMCGRVGTFMRPWAIDQGGTLSDEQIRQLAVLITEGQWELAQEHADEVDAEATGHATVQMPDGPLRPNDTELIVSSAQAFSIDQTIRIGEDKEEERIRIIELPTTGQKLAQETGRTPTRFQVSSIHPREARLRVERGVEDSPVAQHGSRAAIVALDDEGEETETGQTLLEAIDRSDELLVVSGTRGISTGALIRVDQESMRVVEVERAQRQVEVGDIIRIDGELMRVEEITDNGDTSVVVDEDRGLSAASTRLKVSDASRLRKGDVLRIDEELVRVVEPVSTGRTLREAIGRAERSFPVSGTEGIRPGTIIRLEGELLRVVEVEAARLRVERGAEDSQAAPHRRRAAIFAQDDEEGEAKDTGETLLEAIDAEDRTLVVSGTEGISPDAIIRVDRELLRVVDIEQARLRVERAAEGSRAAAHASGLTIFDDNLVEVERGIADSDAASHDDGARLYRFVLRVKRAVEGSPLQDHSVNAELFLGNRLIVERGVLETEPREHRNGSLVYNFPPPAEPELTRLACGDPRAGRLGGETPAGPTPTPPVGAQEVTIVAENVLFDTDTITVKVGPVVVHMDNRDQGVQHNFAVYTDDTASEPLMPTSVGEICTGPCRDDVQFEAAERGTYFFRCDVHPTTMVGDFIVE